MKHVFSVVLVLTIIFLASSAFAQDPGSKLFRGLLNTTTGFLELPITIWQTSKNEGYPTGLTIGLGKGLVNSVYRTLVGVYEVVTFPIPAPAGYESILTPGTLWTGETLENADPAMRGDFKPLGADLGKAKK